MSTLDQGQTHWRPKAIQTASCTTDRNAGRLSFGPIRASVANPRFFHFCTVVGLMP